MFRSNPKIDRAIEFFKLPKIYCSIARLSECRRSSFALAADLLKWFFDYKTFPDNYSLCRLWEVDRSEWKYYYGSNYQAYQRAALRREVQPESYAILFRDKSICECLCRHQNIKMPRMYGVIRPYQNYRKRIGAWLEDAGSNGLVVKPLVGAGGRGVLMACRQDDGIFMCTASGDTPLEQFMLGEDCLVQERIKQDPRLAVMSIRSLNTIRVVTMLTKMDETAIVVAALLRCAIGGAYVDNWSAGGAIIGVDVETGMLHKRAYDKQGNAYTRHPTTNICFDGYAIPEWQRILTLALKTQKLFPFHRLLGMDIALAESGIPVLIEINPNPDLMGQEQASGPLLRREQVLQAFGQEGLLINRHQRKLYANLNHE